MERIWRLALKKYDNILLQLLYNRGVISRADDTRSQDKYFNPDFAKDLHNPLLLPDIKKTIERIKKAEKKNEVVGIFADYDADGIPGAALLSKAFDQVCIKHHVFIPSRTQGYGLSKEGIDYLIKKGCQLIVTIDLGTKDFAWANYCKKKNIDLIITDHHLPDKKKPSALAVVNPKLKSSKYPFKELSGAGVVYKIIQALSKEFKEIDEKFLKWNLDLVAISTISDVVPLTGENRVLAKYGLIVLQKTENLGLQSLYKISRIKKDEISAYHVGFQIGPRINAPGRVEKAAKSYQLLVTDDRDEANKLAIWLEEKNQQRQDLMEEVEKDASQKIEKNKLFLNKIIVAKGSWPKGVLGPAASHIAEKYSRPSILLSHKDEVLSGSARSIKNINITQILGKVSENLNSFGGHSGAAGLSLHLKKYDKFINDLNKIAKEVIDEKDLIKKIDIDAKVAFNELHLSLFDDITKFEPFGMKNKKPLFMAQNLNVLYPRFVGKREKHLSFILEQKGKKIKSIFFNYQEDKEIVKKKMSCDAVFSIMKDTWNGKSKLSLNIIDLKLSSQYAKK